MHSIIHGIVKEKKSLNAMHSIIHGIIKAKSLMLYIALSICDDMSLQWFMLSSFFLSCILFCLMYKYHTLGTVNTV